MNYDPGLENEVVDDGEATICPELEVGWYALRALPWSARNHTATSSLRTRPPRRYVTEPMCIAMHENAL